MLSSLLPGIRKISVRETYVWPDLLIFTVRVGYTRLSLYNLNIYFDHCFTEKMLPVYSKRHKTAN